MSKTFVMAQTMMPTLEDLRQGSNVILLMLNYCLDCFAKNYIRNSWKQHCSRTEESGSRRGGKKLIQK